MKREVSEGEKIEVRRYKKIDCRRCSPTSDCARNKGLQ